MNQEQRARALGVSVRHLRKLEAKGCPQTLDGARQWRAMRIQPRVRNRLSWADELMVIWKACDAALGALAKNAAPEDMSAAIHAYVKTLREHGIEEEAIARLFIIACHSMGVPE